MQDEKRKEYLKQYMKVYRPLYYAKNKENVLRKNKLWKDENKERMRFLMARWQREHPEKTKKWKQEHPERIKEIGRIAMKKRRENKQLKLYESISKRISESLCRGTKKGRRWETIVGYTLNELKEHLEKQFKEGMSWNNRGDWHIDHKIPVTAFYFDEPDDIDFKRCWALSNLQPLWAAENISKSNKVSVPFQPSLNIKVET